MEIEGTLDIISTIILGPELEGNLLEANDDKAIGKIIGCPMLNAHRRAGCRPAGTPAHCQVFCQSTVENLNPRYTMSYSKRMCTGDPYCEYAIEINR